MNGIRATTRKLQPHLPAGYAVVYAALFLWFTLWAISLVPGENTTCHPAPCDRSTAEIYIQGAVAVTVSLLVALMLFTRKPVATSAAPIVAAGFALGWPLYLLIAIGIGVHTVILAVVALSFFFATLKDYGFSSTAFATVATAMILL